MLRKTLQMGSGLYVVFSAVLLMSSTSVSGADDKPTMEVKVAGTPAQLAAFDKAFRPNVGAAEPLGCLVTVLDAPSSCDDLQKTPVPPSATDLRYEFLGSHTSVYEKVGSALNQVQPPTFSSGREGLPMLTIRPILVPDRDCSLLPQPCVAAPFCIQFGRCSKQQGTCIKCQ